MRERHKRDIVLKTDPVTNEKYWPSVYMLSCTTKKCQNWHFLVVMAWRHELNLLPLHYQKVPILAKIRNDM